MEKEKKNLEVTESACSSKTNRNWEKDRRICWRDNKLHGSTAKYFNTKSETR